MIITCNRSQYTTVTFRCSITIFIKAFVLKYYHRIRIHETNIIPATHSWGLGTVCAAPGREDCMTTAATATRRRQTPCETRFVYIYTIMRRVGDTYHMINISSTHAQKNSGSVSKNDVHIYKNNTY